MIVNRDKINIASYKQYLSQYYVRSPYNKVKNTYILPFNLQADINTLIRQYNLQVLEDQHALKREIFSEDDPPLDEILLKESNTTNLDSLSIPITSMNNDNSLTNNTTEILDSTISDQMSMDTLNDSQSAENNTILIDGTVYTRINKSKSEIIDENDDAITKIVSSNTDNEEDMNDGFGTTLRNPIIVTASSHREDTLTEDDKTILDSNVSDAEKDHQKTIDDINQNEIQVVNNSTVIKSNESNENTNNEDSNDILNDTVNITHNDNEDNKINVNTDNKPIEDTKVEVKQEAIDDSKEETKTETKQEVIDDSKEEPKVEVKQEAIDDSKEETKTETTSTQNTPSQQTGIIINKSAIEEQISQVLKDIKKSPISDINNTSKQSSSTESQSQKITNEVIKESLQLPKRIDSTTLATPLPNLPPKRLIYSQVVNYDSLPVADYNNEKVKYVHYASSAFPSFIRTSKLPVYTFGEEDVVIMTGSNSRHFTASLRLLYTIVKYRLDIPFVYIDLGLDPDQVKQLVSTLSFINTLRVQQKMNIPSFYRKVAFYALQKRLQSGKLIPIMALESIIQVDIAEECQGKVIWIDPNTIIKPNFFYSISYLNTIGFISPFAYGDIQELSHPEMIHYFNLPYTDFIYERSFCSAELVGLNYQNSFIWKSIALPWRECSFTRECHNPVTSTFANHRHTQASLTWLVQYYNVSQACSRYYYPRWYHFYVSINTTNPMKPGFLFNNEEQELRRFYISNK